MIRIRMPVLTALVIAAPWNAQNCVHTASVVYNRVEFRPSHLDEFGADFPVAGLFPCDIASTERYFDFYVRFPVIT